MDLLQPLLRRFRGVLGLTGALVLSVLPGLARLKTDNSPQAFFVDNQEALVRYRRFEERFGGDQLLRLVLSGEIWTPEVLAWLARLEDEASAVVGVEAAVGFAGRYRAELLDWPPRDAAALRERVLADPLDRSAGWVSAEGEMITVLVQLSPLTPAAREEVLAQLGALVTSPPPRVEAFLVGLPLLERAMDDAFRRLYRRIFPILGLTAVALLALVFRRWADVAVALIFVAAVLVVLLGTMGYAGERLNLVSVLLLPLVFVIALATALHVLVCYRRHARQSARRQRLAVVAVAAAYSEKAWPVFWTGATTVIAFGSLMTSSVPPVRALGLWTALGLGVVTLEAFTLLPALLMARRAPDAAAAPTPFETRGRRWGALTAAWAVRRRGRVSILAATLAVLAAAGLPRLEMGTSLRGYFSPDHPVRRDLARLERQGLGAMAVEVVLEKPVGGASAAHGGFREPAALEELGRLTAELRSEPRIFSAVGAGDLLQAMIRSMVVEGEVDEDLEWLVLGLAESDPEARRLLRMLVSPRGESARIHLAVPLEGYDVLDPLFARTLACARQHFPASEAWITGQFPLLLESQRRLLQTLVGSFSVTLAAVAGIFLLLLRRPRLAILALLPNLWPVLLVLGAMGWLRVPVDSTTVIVAAVVLGLAVDDTLHTLDHFRRRAGGKAAEAVRRTLERIAPAHLLTTLLLVAGFGICAFSDFVPVARFGALTAGALVAALAGDLVLLPALLGGPQNRIV